jgi:hypothetical protein
VNTDFVRNTHFYVKNYKPIEIFNAISAQTERYGILLV